MAAKKTTVTHADGTVSVRRSQSRNYTHAIEVSPAPVAAHADYLTRRAATLSTRAATLRAAADAGAVVIHDRQLRSERDETCLHSHTATLQNATRSAKGNDEVYTWCSADGRTRDYGVDRPADGDYPIVDVRAYLADSARRGAAAYEAEAAKRQAEAAEALAAGGPVGDYWVARWSSRPDLAHKALAEFAHLSDRGCTVRVIPVDPA